MKKRKTSVMVQVNNKNASTPSKDKAVVTCASTVFPKTVKKKKKTQTSCDLSDDNLEISDKKSSKVNKATHSILTSSDDNMQNIFLLNLGLNKQEKKKKNKSCYSNNDELKNEYVISDAPNNNQATINTLANSDNNINYSLLQKKTKKKKRKNVKKVQVDYENVFTTIPKNDEDNYNAETIRTKLISSEEADSMKPEQHVIEEHKVHLNREINAVEVCQMSFASVSEPKTKLHASSGAKSCLKCDVCGLTFHKKSHFSRHYRTHTGERPYSCDVCGKSFADNSNLISHCRTHTGERPYSCDVCGKSFAHSLTLTVHYRTHTGEKPYECKFCDMSFTTSGHRNKHTLRIHVNRLKHWFA